MNALYTTLIISLLAAVIATVIGTAAAIAIHGMKQKWRTLYSGLTNIPMMNAEIVMGVSLMLLFIAFHVTLGFGTILIAHITFNIPYVILSVAPKLRQTSRRTYEAALDLGASPLYAFFKVTFPDILPGVLSGFMLAFTMSLDDFVITHFTKGPGVDTLSTKIYSEVRKGIKPEMYALSTLLFVTVLVLLILVNVSPKKDAETAAARKHVRRRSRAGRILIKRVIPVAICLVFVGGGIYYASKGQMLTKEKLIVYNWGEYMDPDVITLFEEETGIDVVYEEFETNEIMYPKISSGAIAYDLVCPSDYMIQRMRENDLLAEINFDNIPNIKNIGKDYLERSKEFDPENKYSVPYCWGTVGILYHTTSHPECDAAAQETIQMVTEQNERLTRLVRTLLDMSELQSVARNDKIELHSLIEEVLTDLEPLAQEKNVELIQKTQNLRDEKAENKTADLILTGSDILIYRMLYNLVENAIKYNHTDGNVTVSAVRMKNTVVLTVADTGNGIEESFREQIFEPFFRIDKSRSRQLGGVGLGLALVREIVRVHDGTIEVHGNEQGGTTFEITMGL